MATRQQIYLALFALTAGITWSTQPSGFVTRSRRVKLFSDVPSSGQPALYQAEHGEQSLQKSRLPYLRTFAANWIIYQDTGKDPNAVPADENNLILDAIYEAIAPAPTDPGFQDQRNTLGGIVHHCYIEGEVFKDPGDIDNQGMLVVPIKLLVP